MEKGHSNPFIDWKYKKASALRMLHGKVLPELSEVDYFMFTGFTVGRLDVINERHDLVFQNSGGVIFKKVGVDD